MREKTQYFIDTSLEKLQKSDISDLQGVIRFHNELYYLKEDPIISDFQYDTLFKKLKLLEKKYEIWDPTSPTQKIDLYLTSQFSKKNHADPMISLDNTYDAKDMIEFEQRIQNILKKQNIQKTEIEYIVELKFDGLGMSLTYENGKLIQALTRWDGITGEDITINALYIQNIPKTIPEKNRLEIRWEVIMPLHAFEELNKKQLEIEGKIFSNPRNAVSWSVRQINYEITKERKVEFFAYASPLLEKNSKTYEEMIETFKKWNFDTSPYLKKFPSIQKVIWEITSMKSKPIFPFEFDGLVLKINNLLLWPILGTTHHHPRYSIAYKFPATYEKTKVKNILHSVGRTGIITPVAQVEPVSIWGVIIKNATLHNYDELFKKDVRIWDEVFIVRAGEVIPEIVSVITESRTGSEEKISIPKTCPICNSEVKKEEDKVAYFCSNTSCPGKIQGNFEWFIGKSGLNIDGFGGKQIELFLRLHWISDWSSLFYLKNFKEELLQQEGYKQKSVQNLFNALEKARIQPCWRVLSALGISGVGKKTAQVLSNYFEKNSDFIDFSMTPEELKEIPDIGPETAKNISLFFQENKEKITDLIQELSIEYPEKIKKESQIFSEKIFVITGSFEKYSRDELSEIIKKFWGKTSSSISKKTDFLLLGKNAGSKLEKAKKLQTSILEEKDFLHTISNH